MKLEELINAKKKPISTEPEAVPAASPTAEVQQALEAAMGAAEGQAAAAAIPTTVVAAMVYGAWTGTIINGPAGPRVRINGPGGIAFTVEPTQLACLHTLTESLVRMCTFNINLQESGSNG